MAPVTNPFLPQMPERLPDGWTAATPTEADVEELIALVAADKQAITGSSLVQREAIVSESVGRGSWTRRQVLLRDPAGRVRVWARVHDRAAGRTMLEMTIDPDLEDATDTEVARSVYAWEESVAQRIAKGRGLGGTQLDASLHEADGRGRRHLEAAGYSHVRTWLQMTRPVTPADDGLLEANLREGVQVRPVARHADRSPVAADLQTVHRMLEDSFADHFNSYRESFPEFLHRLREDPGHRWDLWWIATVEIDGDDVPGGALAATITAPDEQGRRGSYVEYIGVHRLARGRGVAKSLLHAVIADAARRGHDRVTLEVDADSPTGADGLYRALGWELSYRTESWHRDILVPDVDAPVPEPQGDVPDMEA